MTIHYRGLPVGYTNEFAPLCSTRAEPVQGSVTTQSGDVTCANCRKILKLESREWAPKQPKIPWDQKPASRAQLAPKDWNETGEYDRDESGDEP